MIFNAVVSAIASAVLGWFGLAVATPAISDGVNMLDGQGRACSRW